MAAFFTRFGCETVLAQIRYNINITIFLVFQAFKFTDEHGEVCPANWRPGKKTMKPNREGIIGFLGSDSDQPAK